MPKTKTAKKTKTKRVAPINPKLQRVFELLESAHERISIDDVRDKPTFDKIVEALLDALHGGVATLDGAKKTISVLAAHADDEALQECVEIAEELHRATCVCCRTNTRAA